MITVMVEGEILVEGGACINILPVTKLKHFKKKVEDLLPHTLWYPILAEIRQILMA